MVRDISFVKQLQKKHQTFQSKKNIAEIDYNSVKFLDADLRNINRKKNRVIVYICNEVKTKKKIVFGKYFSKNADCDNVISDIMDELLALGYRMRKAKQTTCKLLDLHNNNINTYIIKEKNKLI